MSLSKDVIVYIIQHEGDCMGIACDNCPFGSYVEGRGYNCPYYDEVEIFTTAKKWLYTYYPDECFDLVI